MIQRQDDSDGATATQTTDLAAEYRSALATARQTGDFQHAAEILNGFSRPDIESRLAELSADEINYLHLGAVGNPKVGPQSQLAQMTGPGSRPAQAGAAPVPAAPAKSVADMTPNERLEEAYRRADIGEATREKLQAVLGPEALVAAIVGFAVVFIAAQFTPVGWAADFAIGVTALFIGTALLTAANHLINFASARTATTDAQIDWAGQEFARAVAEIGVDAILLLITHRAGSEVASAGPPPPGAGSQGMVLALSNGQRVVVAAETVPVAVAGQLGIAGGGTAMAMAGRPGSGGRPGGRDWQPPVRDHQGKVGGELPATGEERAAAVKEWSHEELLEAEDELQQSIAARQAEQQALGEDTVGAQGQQVGAAHRVRIEQEVDLLRAVRKKLSGS